MKKYFLDLFEYNDWANSRMLITLEEAKSDDYQLLLLFSHLLSSQIIWFNRIKDLPTSPFPLWQKYKLRELKSMTEESSANWLNFIRTHKNDTFEEMINYKTTRGEKFESTIRQIVTQVANHSTYHRAQMVDILKQLSIQPPPTDYILWCRMK